MIIFIRHRESVKIKKKKLKNYDTKNQNRLVQMGYISTCYSLETFLKNRNFSFRPCYFHQEPYYILSGAETLNLYSAPMHIIIQKNTS